MCNKILKKKEEEKKDLVQIIIINTWVFIIIPSYEIRNNSNNVYFFL